MQVINYSAYLVHTRTLQFFIMQRAAIVVKLLAFYTIVRESFLINIANKQIIVPAY